MSVADAIRTLRERMGSLSQERFARELNLTVRTVARYESGASVPKDRLLEFFRIAKRHGWTELEDAFLSGIVGDTSQRVKDLASEVSRSAPVSGARFVLSAQQADSRPPRGGGSMSDEESTLTGVRCLYASSDSPARSKAIADIKAALAEFQKAEKS